MFKIETITGKHRASIDRQIAESWGAPFVVSKGKLHDTRTNPGFAAIIDSTVAGYILYRISGNECEITVLESLREKQGIGSALVHAVIQGAKNSGCRRVWLVTTNDNTQAMRFYQRFGFTLKAAYINAMEASRKLKPQIPLTGNDGIPIMHELEFEMSI